jgi:hypothetical protein
MPRWVPLLALLLQDLSEPQAKAVVPTIRDLERAEIEPDAKARERFKAATGAEAPERVVVWRGRARLTAGEPLRIEMVAVPIRTPKGPATLGVAVADGSVVGARLLEHAEAKGTETADFFRQFFLYAYSRDAIARPASDLDGAMKRAAEGKDDGARRLRPLFELRRIMRRMVELNDLLADRLLAGKATAEDAREVAALFDGAPAALEEAAFLGGRAKELAAEFAKARKMAQDVEGHLKAGRAAKAKEAATAFRSMCNGCHGPYLGAFARAREEAGLGNGYFRPGFDLQPDPKLDDAIEGAVANGVRAAVLILSR